MYESFYNLTGKPFDLLPDPEFLYLSPVHRKAITYLDYGIKEKAGFILMTGEVGSGKTTIIKNILRTLDRSVNTSKIFNTGVSAHQLLALINDDFGLDISGRDKVTLFKELYDFLIREFLAGRHCLLMIDEAQNLSPECLEEVRMLSNLETENSKLLQIILVGQPELRKILAAAEMRQLRQRISINCHITPLDREQAQAYILHRLERAGNRDAVAISPEAFDLIHSSTRGIPRLINILCDFLLLSAFVEESREISATLVKEVADDLQFERNYWSARDVIAVQGEGEDADTLPDAEILSSRDELYVLVRQLGARLESLEYAVPARPGLTDESAAELKHRCEVLETAVHELRRIVRQLVDQQHPAPTPPRQPHSEPHPELHPEREPTAAPPPRKGFFQSLLGR